MGTEQNEAATMKSEMVNDLLQHLNTHNSIGPDGVHPRALRELVEMFRGTFNHLSAV